MERLSIRYTEKGKPPIHRYVVGDECPDIEGVWRCIEDRHSLFVPVSGGAPESPVADRLYREVQVEEADLLEGGVRKQGPGWWDNEGWHPPPRKRVVEGARIVARYPKPAASDIVVFTNK